MLSMLGSPPGAKIDEISVLGDEVARLLGRSDLVIDLFLFAFFSLQDEFESTVSCWTF